MLSRVDYPDFSDRNTRTGTLGIVAVGALILAAPFVAQAATSDGEPEVTEVSAAGATLLDANGAPLKCTQTTASDGSEDGTGTWKWDCGDTKIQMRTDATDTTDATDEDAGAKAVARTYWLVSGGDRVNTGELDQPAPGVYAVHRDDVSVAAVERGGLTVYVAATYAAGEEIVDRFVAEEAR
ncbi:hypothetical protein CAFEA_04905 [Corynebacterium afermentans subsp. afermentans]|uniref:Secreted protein n=1 Tax=Corynebacterium afermentans TaxID=38286 RepID=A0A9X8R2N2_9CORY|nr:hypothetical protein Caferm_09365 [Corynebacterium afermentans subsp. afermentans]WJY56592.1 hypothetical protein CAFEA_04905 [Corynebacterium afermentans subsp. afermentans]SIQ14276.1 hypothetical protein SAMN05421802_10759 [Corynebacterium afermentans]